MKISAISLFFYFIFSLSATVWSKSTLISGPGLRPGAKSGIHRRKRVYPGHKKNSTAYTPDIRKKRNAAERNTGAYGLPLLHTCEADIWTLVVSPLLVMTSIRIIPVSLHQPTLDFI